MESCKDTYENAPSSSFATYVGTFHDTIKSGGTKNEGYQAANKAAYGPGGG